MLVIINCRFNALGLKGYDKSCTVWPETRSKPGVYKVPYSPTSGGGVSKSFGEEFQVVKRGR